MLSTLMFPWSYPFPCCLLLVKHGFICKGGCVCVLIACVCNGKFSPLFLLVVFYLEILCEIVTRFVFLLTAFCFPKRDVNFKASAVDRQSDDVVVTTTPVPHNQTTSAHTEAGGEVFRSSFCFPKRDVNFKASAVDRQSDDVVVTTTPVPHNQTTSAHTEAGGEVF